MLFWTVKIGISKDWIEDGFELDEMRLRDMVLSDLRFAYDNEVDVKILESPDPKYIREIQGIE